MRSYQTLVGVRRCAMGLLALAVATPATLAGEFDMTTPGSTVTIGAGLFETVDLRSTGTGTINSFVRIQRNGVEQGYNTSARPVAFNENTSATFTHDLQLGDVGLRTIGAITYLEFLLDINQNSGGDNEFISLDEVRVYTSAGNGHNSSDLATLGTLRYAMDTMADNWLKLDYSLNAGSGSGDLRFFLPVSLFVGLPATTYITLYSKFGEHQTANDGFEEWATVTGQIPAPGAAALLGAGALLLARRRR